MTGQKPKMAPSRIVQIARAAVADPRTVRRVLNGEIVRGQVGERIADALLADEMRRRSVR